MLLWAWFEFYIHLYPELYKFDDPDTTSRPVVGTLREDLMGGLTGSADVVQMMVRAGIPVWYKRPHQAIVSSVKIKTWVKPEYPTLLSTLR